MKKLLTIFLSLAMMCTLSTTVLATEIGPNDLDSEGKATASATVTYLASSTNTGDETGSDIARDSETWTVTVPATVTVGDSNTSITVVGSVAESKTLKITAPETVTLYLDDNTSNDYTVLNVDFEDIALIGSYKQTSVSADAALSVQNMDNVKFGVWTGTLTFTIEMSDTENWQAHDVLNNN